MSWVELSAQLLAKLSYLSVDMLMRVHKWHGLPWTLKQMWDFPLYIWMSFYTASFNPDLKTFLHLTLCLLELGDPCISLWEREGSVCSGLILCFDCVLFAVAPTFTHFPNDIELASGNRLELICEAIGVPMPEITWLVNGTEIIPSKNQQSPQFLIHVWNIFHDIYRISRF